jgi:microcystin degradation protein MlrC
MKIFAAGISTETNTFCSVPTTLEDFLVQRGRDVLAGRIDYPTLNLDDVWGKEARARGDAFVFSLMAWAQPSGITLKSTYEFLREQLLNDLRSALPVDIVLLMLHGAMVAQDYDDCEEDIIRRVRGIVGSEAVIGVELDLHCHLSDSMIEPADVVITFKEYPHDDVNDRARELFGLCIRAKSGHIQPRMALFDCRMVGLYPTPRQPLRSFVDAMSDAERREGVLSISFGHGFPFADVPHLGAKVLAVTDGDADLATRVATEFGRRVYDLRREIGFDALSLPLEAALSRAIASRKGPVVVADQSDNPGGGAPGDATFALRWLLDHGAGEAALAILYDPEVVRIARKAGVGARLPVRLGGKMGPASGNPVDLQVTVQSTRDSYVHTFPQRSGPPLLFPAGDVAAVRAGSIDIIVSSQRCQCFCPSIFRDLGIPVESKRLLIPKSAQHFYGAFAPISGEVIYMAGPGAVSPDPRQGAYRRLDTSRLYPWQPDPLSS